MIDNGHWICGLAVFLISLAMADRALGKDTAKVVTYGAPVAVSGAPDYYVSVNGQQTFVYNSRKAAFATFSFSGAVEVELTLLVTVESVDIRPLSFRVQHEQQGNTIRFALTEPRHLSIEINGNSGRPLFLFANPLETEVPQRDAAGVRYYRGGSIHNIGVVTLKDNDTVHIEGGAVVRGAFQTRGTKNVRIMGRGILEGTGYGKGGLRMVTLTECTGASVEGITILNSGHWTVVLDRSRDIEIRNLKIINWRDWDDGIDICGSRNITVDGCFIRTKDDCIAIKSVEYWGVNSVGHDVRDIMVKNSVLWNGVWGKAIEIGFESRTESFRDIVFRKTRSASKRPNDHDPHSPTP